LLKSSGLSQKIILEKANPIVALVVLNIGREVERVLESTAARF
jgi:hypothetical protein